MNKNQLLLRMRMSVLAAMTYFRHYVKSRPCDCFYYFKKLNEKLRHENEQNENKIKMNKIKKWKNKTKITEKIKLKKSYISSRWTICTYVII